MLRDLKLPIKMQKSMPKSNMDTEIAIRLINLLFKHVMASVQYDRSSVKLNMLQRGMIGGVLKTTRDGTIEYVIGMNDSDIKVLLDDFERELAKRKKICQEKENIEYNNA